MKILDKFETGTVIGEIKKGDNRKYFFVFTVKENRKVTEIAYNNLRDCFEAYCESREIFTA